jgi:hypothetical protein
LTLLFYMGTLEGKEMPMEKGDLVTVRAFGGELLKRRVVNELTNVVLVCSEKEYRKAAEEGREPDAVGFPKEDVKSLAKSATNP